MPQTLEPPAYSPEHSPVHSLLRQIKASAGSGKTYDLTRRFMEHLARARQEPHSPSCAWGGQSPRGGWGDILAVTFTNSAAAEMKERVVRRLKETALGLEKDAPIAAAHAALWVDIILRQYGALNIRTIDSLLHLVVRTAALDLGLPPDFEPAFTTDETLAPILDACMERAWQGDARMRELLREACRSLIYHADAKGFMAGERILRALRPLLDAAITGQWPELSPPDAVEQRLGDMSRRCMVSAAALLRHLDEEGLSSRKGVRETVARCAEGDMSVTGSAWLAKEHLDECMLKASLGAASEQAQRAYAQLAQAAAACNGPGHILRRGLRLLPFAALAREVGAGLAAFQQAEGKIPGALMPLLAREVLELQHGVPAALCRLGSSLNHILMDEFQDTSRQQWEALRPLVEEALSRGGSLTWVGDIKQAIYGWRGGDASLFDGVLRDRGLRAMAPTPECQSLDTNWRSKAEVVRCNNAVFQSLEQKDVARAVLQAILAKECPPEIVEEAAGKLSHAFAGAVQKTRPQSAGEGADGGHVTITPVSGADSAELAEAVRDELRRRLLDDIALRRPWADVTILVRSNKTAAQVAGWLMEWRVPVITENSLLLGEHPIIVETLAFLAFLDCPQDDLAFWTVTTGTLLDPCLKLPGAPDAHTLRQWAMTRRKGYMSMAFKDAFPHFWQRWFAPFHNKASLLSPYDTVQEWHRLLRVDKRFPQARTFVRRFLEVLHTAAERGHATLGTFLEHWKQNGGDEKVPMPTNTDAVRIMTIHKSKGLQFPVVIIPWMNFSLRDDSPAIAMNVDGLNVLAPRCKEMGNIHYAAQADAAREALNLFYVAWTRPEDELHVFHTGTASQRGGRTLGKALDVLLPAAGLELPCVLGAPAPSQAPALRLENAPGQPPSVAADAVIPPPAVTEPDAVVTPDSVITSDAAEDWRPMHWLPRLKIFRNPLQELTFTAKRRGILAHHCLELLRLTGDAGADALRAVQQGMRTFPLSVPDAALVEEELTRALHWYAALPDTAHWMEHGLPEQSIMDAEGRLHRADLLLPPTADRGWVAVDYKTGHPDEKTEAEYISQIHRYVTLLDALPAEDGSAPLPAWGVLVYLDRQCCRTVTPHGVSDALPAPLPPSGGNGGQNGGHGGEHGESPTPLPQNRPGQPRRVSRPAARPATRQSGKKQGKLL